MDRTLLESEFDDMGLSMSDDIIDECVITCHINKISASDLVGSWIAHCASSQLDASDLNKEKLAALVKSFKTNDGYKTDYKKFGEKKSNLNELDFPQSVNSPAPLKSTRGKNDIENENEIIESINNIYDENTSSTVGDVLCHFECEHVDKSDLSIDVEYTLKQKTWDNFIFGQVNYQKFDNREDEVVSGIIEKNNLKPITPFSELCIGNSNAEITISGSLKLMKKELFLSCPHGCVKLDISEAKLPTESLFVNQIVVVTGINLNTKVFIVKQLCTNASLPLSKNLPTFSQGNMNLIVAAGPFFSESSPHGKSLKSLVQKTIDLEAKLLVLLGPIFETDYGTQLNKAMFESLQKCFDETLEANIKPLFSNPSTQNTKVVVLSSWKDSINYAFYPTPPTESSLPTLYPNNIFMVSDPCVFLANNIQIAGNASDALMGLHSSAINQTKEEMFTKLAKQFVWQRSLHPSYLANPTMPVDQSLWLEHCSLQENSPQIILTSSQLRPFIRVVEGCMFINVGQLVKHNSQKQAMAGTYGKIQIAPSTNGVWSPQTHISAQVICI